MAGLAHEIIFKTETRPAMYRVGNMKEGFHLERCLVHTAKQGPHFGFICETGSGDLLELQHDDLLFLDSAEKFGEIAWDKLAKEGK